MNREILFRGKTEALSGAKRWVYGSLVTNPRTGAAEIHTEPVPDYRGNCYVINIRAVDLDTVGQYTGLEDKNGVKIFEGDILDYPRWVVTYLADTGEGLGMNAGWYIQRDNFESWIELSNTPDHVVLGNIYDNPELLGR